MCSSCLHKETCKYREKLEGDLSKDIKHIAKKLGIPSEILEISCIQYQHQPAISEYTLIECGGTNASSYKYGTDLYIGNTLSSFTN